MHFTMADIAVAITNNQPRMQLRQNRCTSKLVSSPMQHIYGKWFIGEPGLLYQKLCTEGMLPATDLVLRDICLKKSRRQSGKRRSMPLLVPSKMAKTKELPQAGVAAHCLYDNRLKVPILPDASRNASLLASCRDDHQWLPFARHPEVRCKASISSRDQSKGWKL
jgi:hypothetical protein